MEAEPHHDPDLAWEYENGFYLTSPVARLGKALAHYELYRRIVDLPGDVIELGVYKGASLMRWLSFRALLETEVSRHVWAFDAFGAFPTEGVDGDDDRAFVERFEQAGGDGYPAEEIEHYARAKGFTNLTLVAGDVRETLDRVLAERPELRVALVHLDMDVHEPTAFAIERLAERLVPGALVVVDDYGTVDGATRAVDDWCASNDLTLAKLPLAHVPAFVQIPTGWR